MYFNQITFIATLIVVVCSVYSVVCGVYSVVCSTGGSMGVSVGEKERPEEIGDRKA